MKVLFVHNYYSQTGGENIYIENVVKKLNAIGIDTEIFKKISSTDQNIAELGKIALNMLHSNQMLFEFESSLIKYKPTICHIHNIYPHIHPGIFGLCQKHGVKVVLTAHTFRYFCPKGFLFRNDKICELCIKKRFKWPAILNACYHRSFAASFAFTASFAINSDYMHNVDTLISPSNFVEKYYKKWLPERSRPKSYIAIPYGVLDTQILKYAHKSVPQSDYFLFVGRLSEEKGILQLVKVFNSLDIQLVIVGNGPLLEKINKIKKQNINIYPNMTRETISRHYKSALFTIVPSPWYEVGPLVLLESFAHHTPVIAPDIGTFRERIADHKNGFLYKNSNLEDLKKLIIAAYSFSKTNKYVLMQEAAFAEYQLKYTASQHINELVSLYEKLSL